ncbi:hypothetical protein BRADI_3g16433v3, partial [Brachypodium distachyon]
ASHLYRQFNCTTLCQTLQTAIVRRISCCSIPTIELAFFFHYSSLYLATHLQRPSALPCRPLLPSRHHFFLPSLLAQPYLVRGSTLPLPLPPPCSTTPSGCSTKCAAASRG